MFIIISKKSNVILCLLLFPGKVIKNNKRLALESCDPEQPSIFLSSILVL